MANEQTNTGALAYEQVMDSAYKPVFLTKLAHAGIQPRNAQEVEQLLDLGFRLYAMQQEKVAAAHAQQGSLIDYATERLNAIQGISTHEKQANVAYNQMARGLATQRQDVLAAAIALDAHMNA